ncbi:XRE family transcriptional regulator [bacterium]|nr:XRE family transcriptional regulator [bacterium]
MAKKNEIKEIPIGKKIKTARTEKKITLNSLANETGFSTDYIKQIESTEIIPSVGTLLQISKALRIDSSFLFKDQEESDENRRKAYTKRTDNYAYDNLTPGAENKHLKAFKVSIDPKMDHKGVGYCHEGEEFVYVLKGKIEVMVGDHKNTLKKNDFLHFNSSIKHKMKNISDEKAEMIVVIYSP